MDEKINLNRKKKEIEEETYDILQLDSKIKKIIKEENVKTLPTLKEQFEIVSEELKIICNSISTSSNSKKIIQHKEKLEKEKKELEDKIEDLENNNTFSEYLYMSQKIINEYISLAETPKNVSSFFSNKPASVKDNNSEVKYEELISQFLDIAIKYVPIKTWRKEKVKKHICPCGNSKEFIYGENIIVCDNCSLESNFYSVQTTYKDTDRVNLSQKYKYKRRIHFRDTLNQYQGKQNKKINKQVIEDLEKEFIKRNLQNKNGNTFHEKYKNITKGVISMFLTETGHNNHYEDLNLLHNYFTGIPCPDVSHIEEELFEDFDKIVEVYDSLKDITRKNFLNSQYVLYQLLKRRNIKVKDDDFDILKSRDRLNQHEEIFQKISLILEWNISPLL
jgi:hypothetical protein